MQKDIFEDIRQKLHCTFISDELDAISEKRRRRIKAIYI